MKLDIQALTEYVRFFGRTFFDGEKNAVFFNWTGAGFEMAFSGKKVELVLEAEADFYPTEGTNIPWVAVLKDDEKVPCTLLGLTEKSGTYTVFERQVPETHRLTVIKRSENSKGRVSLKEIHIDGSILRVWEREAAYRLEFIGDSITCGYGIETGGDNQTFSTALENGLNTYSAITAGLLNADYNSICISGIPLCPSYDENFRIVLPDFADFETPRRAMEAYYAYTDRFQQEAAGLKSDFEEWEFDRFRPDAIIVNLGTNDAFRVKAAGNDREEEAHFERRYKAFLYTLRQFNGLKPVIACTLGPMDYFLYDNILRAVAAFKAETGDERIFCFKYGAIFHWGEGIGALDHPSSKTHERMGRELAAVLQGWLQPTNKTDGE